MTERGKVIEDFERYYEQLFEDERRLGEYGLIMSSPEERLRKIEIVGKALALLKDQQARVMTLEEVKALPYGYVLLETDKAGSLRWVDALLFCKHTNFSFDFITLEGRARLLGTDYNKEWRCWTSRPTDAQIEATPRLRAEEAESREPGKYGLSELSELTADDEYYREAQYIIKNRLSLLDFDCWTYIEECLGMKVPYCVYSEMDSMVDDVILTYPKKEIVTLYKATKLGGGEHD